MAVQINPQEAVLDLICRTPFGVADILRRAQGDTIAAYGLGPSECAFQIIAAGSHWRLRDYGNQGASASLLIVAAPIKRPYIWDLAPSASAIRYCLRHDLHVHLLEWMPATRDISNTGIDECAVAIADCVATISATAQGSKPFVIGHSLGGTLAAIYAAFASETMQGLVLLGAPLCFKPDQSQFRDALVSLIPSNLSDAEPVPGSLLSHMSALASPSTFIWSRLMDAAASVSDPHAMDVHARVERWALDEMPLPGKLVHQIVEWLYRENRLCQGTLKVQGCLLAPSRVSVPTLAVVNTADEVAPPASVKPFIDALPREAARTIEYPGEMGVGLQHLGVLVGRQAYARVWPQIIAWLKSQRHTRD